MSSRTRQREHNNRLEWPAGSTLTVSCEKQRKEPTVRESSVSKSSCWHGDFSWCGDGEGRLAPTLTKSQAVLRRRLALDGLAGAHFHVTVVAKYTEVAKLPWQRSWCFQQMWPDVFPGGTRVHEGWFTRTSMFVLLPRCCSAHHSQKVQNPTCKNSIKLHQKSNQSYYPAFSGLGCIFAWVCTKIRISRSTCLNPSRV